MTGLEVTEIKMTVKDMLTNEEIAKQEEDNKTKPLRIKLKISQIN